MSDATAPRRPSFSGIVHRLWSPWSFSVGLLLAVFVLDQAQFLDVLNIATDAFAHTMIFVLFAVTLIAGLKAAGAETMIGRAFQGREVPAIIAAALFGGLAPFCSCEVIPFVAGLIALGAPLGAIMAFWLASPLIDPGSLLVTAGALGWDFAIGKAVAAVGLGLFGGFVTMAITRAGGLRDVAKNGSVSCSSGGCGCGPDPMKENVRWAFWRDAARIGTFRKEFVENLIFLVKWLFLAYVLEALLITYVKPEWIAGFVGGEGVGTIALSAVIGMPTYLNSYAAPALLAGLTDQGMSAGSAMAFMVAGAVSSIPAMTAIWALVKPRVFALYLLLGLAGAVLAGMAFQAVV